MATESVGQSQNRRGTNQFMRQGHTANEYGNDPSQEPTGVANKAPRELKP